MTDINNIPQSQLDKYTHSELMVFARLALHKLDVFLLRDRWLLANEKPPTKKQLIRLIRRFSEYGTKS